MKALITGGAGFIGSHLAAALLHRGVAVRVLDDFSSGSPANLHGLAVEVIRGDVADLEMVKTAVSGCDVIFHQAALVSVPQSITEPVRNHNSNVSGTFNVFEAARQAGVPRIVYASSAAVYGNLPGLPKREDSPVQPLTPYAAAKYGSELLAAVYAANYGMTCVGLRYMNVFGPRQDPSSPYSGVLSIFCRRVLEGAPLTVHGDGEQTRDFIYVDDVVQANLLAAETGAERLGETAVFNVGRGQQTSLNQIIALLGQIVGRTIDVQHQAPRQGDIKHSVANIDLARAKLNFDPQTSLLTGLRHTIDWFAAAQGA